MAKARQLYERLGVFSWVMLVLLGLGLGLVVWAHFVDDQYYEALLLHLGTALFLFAPLLVVGRMVEDRIEAVSRKVEGVHNEVRSAGVRIDELRRATANEIAAQRAADADAVEDLRDDVSEENTLRLLRRARNLDAIDARGTRVRLPSTELWLRFADLPGDESAGDSDVMLLSVEGRDGDPVAKSERWSPLEPAEQVLVRLAEELQRAGKYPGDDTFDAGFIFRRLSDTFDTALSLRTGGRKGANIGPVVELAADWAVTTFGLENVTVDRRVPALLLRSDPDRARAELMADAVVTADDAFEEALTTAVEYHRGEDRRAARARLLRAR